MLILNGYVDGKFAIDDDSVLLLGNASLAILCSHLADGLVPEVATEGAKRDVALSEATQRWFSLLATLVSVVALMANLATYVIFKGFRLILELMFRECDSYINI